MTTELLEESLSTLEDTVTALTKLVPPPQEVPFCDSFVFRHVEKTPQQALVQKLARLPSTLRAARVLMTLGLFQEQAALQRMIDEIQEDATFLALGILDNDLTPLHQEYLDAFFLEEQDPVTGATSDTERPMVRRKKIRAYNARAMSSSSDPSGHVKVSRDLSKLYSGFVHAASPHIMDMYMGMPPRFHMSGMLGTERELTFKRDIYNYFFRSINAAAFGAYALKDVRVGNVLHDLAVRMEEYMDRSKGAP